jgi:hypothetical protein
MEILTGFLALVGVGCFSVLVLALYGDTFALWCAARLKARVEGRMAYQTQYAAALKRLHQEYGLEERV